MTTDRYITVSEPEESTTTATFQARLFIFNSEGKREVDLAPHNTIGRDTRNSIRISDRLVSKEHCIIFHDEDRGFVIRDMGSSNGTFVNSEVLQGDVLLSHGDTITLGATRCMFVCEQAPETAIEIESGDDMMMLSLIRSKIAPKQDRFLPEQQISDDKVVRADYEKLRMAHELQRDIGLELNLDRIFKRILDHTFSFLNCDRGVILMDDEHGELEIRALKTRKRMEKLIVSSTLVKQVQTEKVGIISADALSDERFDGSQSILMQMIRSSMTVPILHENELLGIMMIDSSEAVNAYNEKDLLLLTNIANQTALFVKNAQMAKKIQMEAVTRERFQRLLSPDLAEMVVSGELKVEKGGENRVATVLFADIRGFTAMSENMSAQEVLQMLNEYFEMMVEIAFRYEGTVDKFVGDMIMVIWGAPVIHEDDPIRAVHAALDMQAALIEYNKARVISGHRPIEIGIGITTGELVAGYIGSHRTMSYSVIGDTVNTASRLCSAAKAGQVLVSEDTCRYACKCFEVEELTPVKAKGKSQPVKVFNVSGRC